MILSKLNRKLVVSSEIASNLTALDTAVNTTKFSSAHLEPMAIGARNIKQSDGFLLTRKFGIIETGASLTYSAQDGMRLIAESVLSHAATLGAARNREEDGNPVVLVVARLYLASSGINSPTTSAALASSSDGGFTYLTLPNTTRPFGPGCGAVQEPYALPQLHYFTGSASYIPHNASRDKGIVLLAAMALNRQQGNPATENRYGVLVDADDTTQFLGGEISLYARDTGIT